jgi:hypothetical protein
MEYDLDDPPPGEDYWGFLNRWAEEAHAMGARLRRHLIFAADFLSTPVFSRRALS